MKMKGLILILLSLLLLSCSSTPVFEEQAKTFFTLLQNHQFDKCVDMDYAYQVKMAKINEEPQFKQLDLALKLRSDIKADYFDMNKESSIAYLFMYPCTWQLLESKNTTSEIGDITFPVYRIYAVVKYQSMDQSPDAVPLLLKAEAIHNNNYKVKEITFHIDLDPDNAWYIGWGTDQHVPW